MILKPAMSRDSGLLQHAVGKRLHMLEVRAFPIDLAALLASLEGVIAFEDVFRHRSGDGGLLDGFEEAIAANAAFEWRERRRQIIAAHHFFQLLLRVGLPHEITIRDDAAFEQANIAREQDALL